MYTTLKELSTRISKILVAWVKRWLINFNPAKTEAVLFILKQLGRLPNLIFDNIQIRFLEFHKHLGLTFSKNGQWHMHIENILTSAAKIVGIMRRLKFKFTRVANRIFMCFFIKSSIGTQGEVS